MAHAENEITIDRTAAEVYDFLADGLNNTAWRSGVKDIGLASGDAGQLGAVYSQTLTGPRGKPIQGTTGSRRRSPDVCWLSTWSPVRHGHTASTS
ncbi:SRPBCC family protein [Arthrobacter sp. Leaf337]|uniref:SRPBCC family protein n=1 Tax=Arthrobacter sp. Leaf337 TaxID=1736342 RepID=UPI001F437A67|nr:SRPBCC family protein [Arthrobacter sp. Leaf337]